MAQRHTTSRMGCAVLIGLIVSAHPAVVLIRGKTTEPPYNSLHLRRARERKPSEKGTGKGKGKGKDQVHSLAEAATDGEVDEAALANFIQEAGWWAGESFAALTDVRCSRYHTSSSNALESECSEEVICDLNFIKWAVTML